MCALATSLTSVHPIFKLTIPFVVPLISLIIDLKYQCHQQIGPLTAEGIITDKFILFFSDSSSIKFQAVNSAAILLFVY